MICIENDQLVISFPALGPDAVFRMGLQRTLRLPDDHRTYALPPSLGRFPVHHVDDYVGRVPAGWRDHGGAFFPMWQSEALWLSFHNQGYPCAIKIAAGKINAVDGSFWSNELHQTPGAAVPQDYMVSPGQLWLDGFNVGQGRIRQFVAMPLGQGYTAEEQITGRADHGGIQIMVYPMKRSLYDAMKAQEAERQRQAMRRAYDQHDRRIAPFYDMSASSVSLATSDILSNAWTATATVCANAAAPVSSVASMGLAAGGLMSQTIQPDTFGLHVWDLTQGTRCFLHILNSEQYQHVTGRLPATLPPRASDYARHGLPWFTHYDEHPGLPGAPVLAQLDSVAALGVKKQQTPLPDNDPLSPLTPTMLGSSPFWLRTVQDRRW